MPFSYPCSEEAEILRKQIENRLQIDTENKVKSNPGLRLSLKDQKDATATIPITIALIDYLTELQWNLVSRKVMKSGMECLKFFIDFFLYFVVGAESPRILLFPWPPRNPAGRRNANDDAEWWRPFEKDTVTSQKDALILN